MLQCVHFDLQTLGYPRTCAKTTGNAPVCQWSAWAAVARVPCSPACLGRLTTLPCPGPQSQVRAPTHIVSTICDDRGEEPTYNGVSMSELMEADANVGDAIG